VIKGLTFICCVSTRKVGKGVSRASTMKNVGSGPRGKVTEKRKESEIWFFWLEIQEEGLPGNKSTGPNSAKTITRGGGRIAKTSKFYLKGQRAPSLGKKRPSRGKPDANCRGAGKTTTQGGDLCYQKKHQQGINFETTGRGVTGTLSEELRTVPGAKEFGE